MLCIVMLACLTACGLKIDPKESGPSGTDKPAVTANNGTNSEAGDQPVSTANNGTDPKASEKPQIIENNVTDSEDMIVVDSPIGKLYYPKKWKDDVTFQVNGNQLVALYYDNPLFTLYFGGEEGYLYGTVKNEGEDIELRYDMHDLDSTQEDYETMCSMQEDINVIFQYLIQEGKLVDAG